jgi:hypothetical protein
MSGNIWIGIGTLTVDRRVQWRVNMELLQHTIEVNVEVSFVVYINSLQGGSQPSEDTSRD